MGSRALCHPPGDPIRLVRPLPGSRRHGRHPGGVARAGSGCERGPGRLTGRRPKHLTGRRPNLSEHDPLSDVRGTDACHAGPVCCPHHGPVTEGWRSGAHVRPPPGPVTETPQVASTGRAIAGIGAGIGAGIVAGPRGHAGAVRTGSAAGWLREISKAARPIMIDPTAAIHHPYARSGSSPSGASRCRGSTARHPASQRSANSPYTSPRSTPRDAPARRTAGRQGDRRERGDERDRPGPVEGAVDLLAQAAVTAHHVPGQHAPDDHHERRRGRRAGDRCRGDVDAWSGLPVPL